jgi:aldehyde:ferredoxin oxidoreductase
MANAKAGYSGRMLRVDLSRRSASVETLSGELYRKYLGGAGLITYLLWKELDKGVDPLGPENKLIFALGPVTGISLPGSGRNCIGAKSPLTGGIAKSEVGEFWGAELKRAGYDVIIIEGQADKPVYLWIHEDEVSIRDAGGLWGQDTREAQQAIRKELGDDRIRVAMIGPGGENQVRYACVMNGLFDAAGRGGLGAVMGAKKLKAIAVRGRQAPPIADTKPVEALRKWMAANLKLVQDFIDNGTGGPMEAFEAAGNLPVRNFRDGLFPGITKISAPTIKETIRVGMDACFACTVRCKKMVRMDAPFPVDPAYGGPEYETLAAIGSNCGIDDLAATSWGSQLCNAYSLDAISVGEVIAFAMECYENGLITSQDTGGIELRFGNAEAMLKMIEMIARREGLGDLLAEGAVRAAQKIGQGAEQYAIAVKGLEAGMHEPRFKPGLGLGFMVNPHGADHCMNIHDSMYLGENWRVDEMKQMGLTGPFPVDDIGPKKVELFRLHQMKQLLFDSLVVCQFLPYNYQQLSELLAAVTGWDTDVAELVKTAERILTLARLFNLREGLTAADDRLPQRFYQPKTDGVLADKPLDPAKLEQAKRYYYRLMGWDEETGVPRPEKVAELAIP